MARDVGSRNPPPRSRNPPNLPNNPSGSGYRDISLDREEYSSTESDSEQNISQQSDRSTPAEPSTDEADHGEMLYRQFLGSRTGHISIVRDPLRNPLQSDMINLAERFSGSADREQVRQRAEEVDLSSVNPENFNTMLSELFHDGRISQERLLVLFFFCSDLTIRACRSGMESLCQALTRWTLAFVRGTVATMVRIRGGWNMVLRGQPSFSDSAIVLGSIAAVATAMYLYLKKP